MKLKRAKHSRQCSGQARRASGPNKGRPDDVPQSLEVIGRSSRRPSTELRTNAGVPQSRNPALSRILRRIGFQNESIPLRVLTTGTAHYGVPMAFRTQAPNVETRA